MYKSVRECQTLAPAGSKKKLHVMTRPDAKLHFSSDAACLPIQGNCMETGIQQYCILTLTVIFLISVRKIGEVREIANSFT